MKDLICYCYEYSAEDIRQDYLENGRSTIMDKIQREKKLGNCQCATKNPKGTGCLGDVRQVVDKIRAQYKAESILSVELPRLISLSKSLNPLKDYFNSNKNKVRFLVLLSPTGPGGAMRGARAVQESIIKQFSNGSFSMGIVWINMLSGDSEETAQKSAGILNDQHVRHFYDPNKCSGKVIAETIGWEEKVAWDIYLFYKPDAEWLDLPPEPVYWMHQLTDDWAKNEHYRTGGDLRNELFVSMKKLLND